MERARDRRDRGFLHYRQYAAETWCIARTVPNCPIVNEPPNNNGLSMIRVDKEPVASSGNIRPVPFAMDGDPDWAAGATVMSDELRRADRVGAEGRLELCDRRQTSPRPCRPSCALCRAQLAVPANHERMRFSDRSLLHGDDDYRRPGAAWNDVFIVRTGART